MDRLNKKLVVAAVWIAVAICAYLLILELIPPDGRGLGGRIGSPG